MQQPPIPKNAFSYCKPTRLDHLIYKVVVRLQGAQWKQRNFLKGWHHGPAVLESPQDGYDTISRSIIYVRSNVKLFLCLACFIRSSAGCTGMLLSIYRIKLLARYPQHSNRFIHDIINGYICMTYWHPIMTIGFQALKPEGLYVYVSRVGRICSAPIEILLTKQLGNLNSQHASLLYPCKWPCKAFQWVPTTQMWIAFIH